MRRRRQHCQDPWGTHPKCLDQATLLFSTTCFTREKYILARPNRYNMHTDEEKFSVSTYGPRHETKKGGERTDAQPKANGSTRHARAEDDPREENVQHKRLSHRKQSRKEHRRDLGGTSHISFVARRTNTRNTHHRAWMPAPPILAFASYSTGPPCTCAGWNWGYAYGG